MKCTICNEDKLLTDFASIYDPMVCKECPPAPDERTCDRCGQLRNAFFFVSSENPNVCGRCRNELRTPTVVAAQDVTAAEVQHSSLLSRLLELHPHKSSEKSENEAETTPANRGTDRKLNTAQLLPWWSISRPSGSIFTAITRVGKSWRNPWGTASAASRSTRSKQEDAEQIKKVFKRALWGWTAFFILGWLWGWTAFFILEWFINHDLKYLAEILVSVGLGVTAAFISTLIYWGIREFLKPNADTVRRADAAESELAELRKKVEELSKQSET